ncbi:MAG: S8 family peptidase [Bernardetiaceae bacterium]|nr:S8 family peptidase [Bernardetiaceae bacterium]
MLKFLILFLISSLSLYEISAQALDYQLIYFTDKNDSPYSLSNPQEFLSARALARRTNQNIALNQQDLPVNPSYVAALQAAGAQIFYTSKWLNAALIVAEPAVLTAIEALPFTQSRASLATLQPSEIRQYGEAKHNAMASLEDDISLPIPTLLHTKHMQSIFGAAAGQYLPLGIDAMHEDGFFGEGLYIAVLDGGFPLVPELSVFQDLEVVDTYNYTRHTEDVYRSNSHGTRVLSAIAAYKPNEMVAPAYKATYALYLTEDTRFELPVEEFFWLAAAERADSLGVDIIHSSLGYYEFDKAQYNYTHDDLDGNTALVTRAANMAAARGMLVITSAGNTGTRPWQKITFPADSDSVLTVGAVDINGRIAPFSAHGFFDDNRIKPDVVGIGLGTVLWNTNDEISTASGTSFSAPTVTGLAAGLWQANPQLTNLELLRLIRDSGERRIFPSNRYGTGIPNYRRALGWLTSQETALEANAVILYPNPIKNSMLTMKGVNRFFNSNHNIQIFCYDMKGRLLFETTFDNTHTEIKLDVSQLKPNLYMLHISDGIQMLTKKFVKE